MERQQFSLRNGIKYTTTVILENTERSVSKYGAVLHRCWKCFSLKLEISTRAGGLILQGLGILRTVANLVPRVATFRTESKLPRRRLGTTFTLVR